MRYNYSVVLLDGHYHVMAQKQVNHMGVWVAKGQAEPLDGVQVAAEDDHALIWVLDQLIAKLNKQVAEMMDWGS